MINICIICIIIIGIQTKNLFICIIYINKICLLIILIYSNIQHGYKN